MIEFNGLQILPQENDYWFVRTDGGKYFDTFLENGFIAIGWNPVTLDDLNNKTILEVKKKIARAEKFDLDNRYQATEATKIYNKILHFRDLRKNNVIVMPSEGSASFSFGVVSTEKTYEVETEVNNCKYYKRRRVKWVKTVTFSELDNIFYRIRRPQHALSNINEYSSHIDSVMYDVFKKDDYSHFVVRVKLDSSIHLNTLATTLQAIYQLMSLVNREFNLNEDIEDSSIKITLQSPGFFNLKQKGIALVLVAMLLGSTGCDVKGNLDEPNKEKAKTFSEDYGDELEALRNKLDSMDVKL